MVDHAKLDSDEFKADVVEDWKNTGIKLVPTNWYEETESTLVDNGVEEN